MNKYIKKINFFLLAFALTLVSCETEESFKITSPDPAFTLQAPGISSVFLNFSLPANNAFTITWNDEVTGSSSYDVEMSLDDVFTAPVTLGTVNTNSFSITVEDLNTAIRNAGAATFRDIAVFLRVKAGSVNSNSIFYLITTYPIENPQITSPDSTFEVVLSDITENETALTVEWIDPFTPEDPSTTVKYYVEAAVAGTDFATIREMGNTQELALSLTHAELNDIAASLGLEPESAGIIDIRVRAVIEMTVGNLVRLTDLITITVTPYETALPPTLWGVGAGLPDAGWGWASPIEFSLQGTVYSANVNLSPDNGGNFRFFTDSSLQWDSPSYNFPWYEDRGYTIDVNFVNANDNDSNFQFVGTAGFYNMKIDTANKTITLSEPVIGPTVSPWGIIGSGYNNWGAFDDAKFYSTDTPNVYVSYVSLVTGEIKFRANNDWNDPLGEFGDSGADGTLDAGGTNIAVTEGNYKITLNFNNNTYTIEEFSWGVVGSGFNNWGADGPDAKFTYDYITNTFKVGVKLIDGDIKFRANNDWNDPLGDFGGSGGTLVASGNNIAVTAGYYVITLDFENGLYSIVPSDILGVIGSGFNNWGADGPDFSFTPLSNDIWVAEIVPLIDGEIKFRYNEDWNHPLGDFGDSGADGTLDAGGTNIAVTTGNYRIVLDLASSTYQINKVN